MSIRVLLVICFNFSSICVSSQFAPVGSEWHYNELTPYRSYSYHKCERDTIIHGRLASLISHWHFGENQDGLFVGNIHLSVSGDTIFRFRSDINQFVPHFYPGNKGDALYLNGWHNSSDSGVFVIDTSRINFAGKTRKVWTLGAKGTLGFKFIEGIGFRHMMVPDWVSQYPAVYKFVLRCYNGEHYVDYPVELGCDSRSLTAIYEADTKDGVSLYPNPTSNSISIRGLDLTSIKQLRILSANGQLVLVTTVLPEDKILNVSAYEAGIYLLYLIDESNQVLIKKFIIE